VSVLAYIYNSSTQEAEKGLLLHVHTM